MGRCPFFPAIGDRRLQTEHIRSPSKTQKNDWFRQDKIFTLTPERKDNHSKH